MDEFTALQIYEIAYKLKRLPEMTQKMLARNKKPSSLHTCYCSICSEEFLYSSPDKKTCSENCSDKYMEVMKKMTQELLKWMVL